jgi:hypothetical protein
MDHIFTFSLPVFCLAINPTPISPLDYGLTIHVSVQEHIPREYEGFSVKHLNLFCLVDKIILRNNGCYQIIFLGNEPKIAYAKRTLIMAVCLSFCLLQKRPMYTGVSRHVFRTVKTAPLCVWVGGSHAFICRLVYFIVRIRKRTNRKKN